jgi:ABC-type multidrug transport system ATPase subunit
MGKPDQRPESLTVKLVDDPTLACREDRRHQVEQRRFGVAFRDLGCYGFIAAASYQATFASFIFLIWEAVQVVLGKRRPQKVTILRNFDGLVLPGEMLLVLGKPGSGCTTFLRTLAGDTHGFHIETTAKVYYQCKSEEPHWWLPLHESNPSSPAIPFAEMHRGMKGECIYLSEHDVHFPELTLGETLAFAASSRESGANQEGDSQISSQKVASMFRLDNVLNTRVGNAMIRGLSGGEKRRTSLAEAFIGNAQLQCWDNSTRGLDSSTALQFVQLLREATRSSQTVVAMSIYQASEAMYEV